MAVPKLITITGKFTKTGTSGTPETGTIAFHVPGFLRSSAQDETITPGNFTATLDSNGECSFQVYATDDVNWTPQGWTYRVLVNLSSYRGVSNVQIPSNAPGDTIDMADLLPVLEAGGDSYAPIAHFHDGYVTDEELEEALEGVGGGGGGAVNSVNAKTGDVVLAASDVGAYTQAQVDTAVGGRVNKTGDVMTGDLVVRDGGNSKGYRLRASGGVLDLEFGGAELWLGGKSGVPGDPFAGTQYRLLILRSNGGGVTAEGLWEFTGTVSGITKSMVGLGSVDNTSDTGKPVSSATQTALNLKADTATVNTALGLKADASAVTTALSNKADLVGGLIPTSQIPAQAITDVFPVANQAAMLALNVQRGDVAIRSDTGRTYILSTDSPTTLADWKEIVAVGVVTSVNGQQGIIILAKGDVGLGNVDNTSDAAKPVSTAQQTALNLKANLANPTFTGTVSGITKAMVGLGNVDNTSDAAKPLSTAETTALALKADLASPTFTGTVGGITKSMVGLGNVDNTADSAKPVSTAQASADAAVLSAALSAGFNATDHQIAAWSYDPAASQGGTVLPTAGLVFSVRMKLQNVTAINNIIMHLTSGGTGLTAGQCFAVVMNDAGSTVLGSTADQASNWAVGGLKVMPLVGAPVAATPYSWVRVAFWFNGTTGPTVTRGSNVNAQLLNIGLTTPRFATSNAGTTTSLTSLGALTASQAAWMIGIS